MFWGQTFLGLNTFWGQTFLGGQTNVIGQQVFSTISYLINFLFNYYLFICVGLGIML
jgi:hypothetical protein